MATQQGSDRWDTRRAKKLLAEQKASGLSIAAFARSQNLRLKRLYYWHSKLSSRTGTTKPPTTSSPGHALVPVEVVAQRISKAADITPARRDDGSRLTVRTEAGFAVDVCTGFDGDTLLRVLDVLAEAARC